MKTWTTMWTGRAISLLLLFVLTVTMASLSHAQAQPTEPDAFAGIRINFQSPDAAVPAGYLRDFGQPFGPRTDAHQV